MSRSGRARVLLRHQLDELECRRAVRAHTSTSDTRTSSRGRTSLTRLTALSVDGGELYPRGQIPRWIREGFASSASQRKDLARCRRS
ncbi:hypothetical protein Y600_6010 [Burkholderia pseudomallei MSHR3709]|nr:hypothetical protein Y600_6010 [Burkholderia pseudomallei MSHR3709]